MPIIPLSQPVLTDQQIREAWTLFNGTPYHPVDTKGPGRPINRFKRPAQKKRIEQIRQIIAQHQPQDRVTQFLELSNTQHWLPAADVLNAILEDECKRTLEDNARTRREASIELNQLEKDHDLDHYRKVVAKAVKLNNTARSNWRDHNLKHQMPWKRNPYHHARFCTAD